MHDSDPDYGDSFADVYDDWYGHITDAAATSARVAALASAAGNQRVLELGIGSGRLALPLLAHGLEVSGIDSSPAMLERLRTKPEAEQIDVHLGDMASADHLVSGPFGVVLIGFNTLFNLTDEARQQQCLQAVRALLDPSGYFVVEAFVPIADEANSPQRGLSTSRVELDRVVLTATEHDPGSQTVIGQHIDITADGTRPRPWRIRYLTPVQLDDMAEHAGLELVDRHADWIGTPSAPNDTIHVSTYRLSS